MGLGDDAFLTTKSILIDGVDEWVNTGVTSHVGDNAGDWTMASWFKTSATGNQFIYSEGKDFLNGNLISMRSSPNIGEKAGIFVRNAANTSVVLYSSANVNDGLWHQVVGTKIGNLYALYLDGGFETSVTTVLGSIPIEHTGIGTLARSTLSNFLTGNINNTSTWNAGLDLAGVVELYNGGVPTNLKTHSNSANLSNWWRLGDLGVWDGSNWTFPNQEGADNGVSDNLEEADVVTDAPA